MNKSILISIRPEHVVKILNGEKTLELRKSVPKGFVGWVYIYVTKSTLLIRTTYRSTNFVLLRHEKVGNAEEAKRNKEVLNGKVVARFWFDEYKLIEPVQIDKDWITYIYRYEEKNNWAMLEEQIPYDEVKKYLNGKKGYVWHIKKLEVFDKPKELYEFVSIYDPATFVFGIMSAPSNWRYVWSDTEQEDKLI